MPHQYSRLLTRALIRQTFLLTRGDWMATSSFFVANIMSGVFLGGVKVPPTNSSVRPTPPTSGR